MAAEGSLLLLEEYFASGDPRFRTELALLDAPRKIGAFAERWLRDGRPWSRELLRDFLLDRSFEQSRLKPLVKRLFKLAEAAGEDRVMAWFLVAADSSIRRKESSTYDGRARQSIPVLRHEVPPPGGRRSLQCPDPPLPPPPRLAIFSPPRLSSSPALPPRGPGEREVKARGPGFFRIPGSEIGAAMAKEIERKFLVSGDAWRGSSPGTRIRQGYLSSQPERTVRIRSAGGKGTLTIKGKSRGATRDEFEYEIPAAEADVLLDQLCERPLVEKTRHRVPFGGLIWEIDVFEGDNSGLVVAEVELSDEEQPVAIPPWVSQEVTREARYFNSNLARHPFKTW